MMPVSWPMVAAWLALPGTLAPAPQPVPDPWPYPQKLAMVQRNVLRSVDGRLDQMALDPVSQHLYVAAHRNNSLEVHHVPDSTLAESVPDLPEPSGVVFVPEERKLIVACAGDWSVRVFGVGGDGRLTAERSVKFPGQTGSVAYDAAAKRVYATHGRALGSFLIETGELGKDIELAGAPAGVVVEPDVERLFTNIPSRASIAVIDRKEEVVEAEWRLAEDPKDFAEGNHALALDAANRRLFVATRLPAKLIVLDTETGREVARVDGICKDSNSCWYDAQTRRVLITGGFGSGAVTGVAQNGPDDYALEFTISTASGARTSLLVPEQRRLYVAAPRLGDDQAYVFVYLIGPR